MKCLGMILFLAATGGCARMTGASETPFVLQLRSRSESGPVTRPAQWTPARTAFIVCDMWDDHWCKGASRRVAELAPRVDAVLQEARRRGALVIHAPSTTVGFYKDSPARRRAQQAPHAATPVPLTRETRWGTTWCWPDRSREGELPIDDSDMGCDCAEKCAIRDAWKRQIASIRIDPERDAITDDGQETWNLLAERSIENVVLLGVHLNMCVLGRPFAIRQMVSVKKNVALIRDLTDTMYNSKRKPFVPHHAGTDLVVEHIERYWCPSFTSADLLPGGPFRFSDDNRPR